MYDHAHETPILWGPLVVLAVLSIFAGYPKFLGAKELIDASVQEGMRLSVDTIAERHVWPPGLLLGEEREIELGVRDDYRGALPWP